MLKSYGVRWSLPTLDTMMCSLVVLVTSTQCPSTTLCAIKPGALAANTMYAEVVRHVAMACQVLLGIPPFALTGAVA